jgi:ABC-type amino acid transport substrate-binding protein
MIFPAILYNRRMFSGDGTRRVPAWVRFAATAALAVLVAACSPRAAVQGPPALPPAPHPAVRGPAVVAVQRAGRLRVAVDLSVPPMAFRDASGPAGLDIDLIGLVAQSLGVPAEITDLPIAAMADVFPRNEDLAAGALRAGMVPGAPTQAYERASPAVVWGARTAGTAPGALRGKRVAAALGGSGERLAENAGAVVVSTYLPEEALAMAGNGRVDAAIAGGPEALGFVSGRARLRTTQAGGPTTSFVFVARPGAADLAGYVSAVIAELRSNGGLDRLRRRWHLS